MIKHSLVCLLEGTKEYSFKALRVIGNPDERKIHEVYQSNITTLNRLLVYCKENNILALRVTSSLFPLSSHKTYRDVGLKAIEEALQLFQAVEGLELSVHPDQFILLSSLNPEVNAQSRYDLELVSHVAQKIPLKLINIHVGSKAQGEAVHRDILKREAGLLSPQAKQLISLENDEKSYDFLATLCIAEENGLMVVPDFHHERCYQRRQSQYTATMQEIDDVIYRHMERIIATYRGKLSHPLFHLSSPSCGWNKKFKDECAHSDYIAKEDYPTLLDHYSTYYGKDFILDIEAKHKQLALLKLAQDIK